MTTNPYQGVNVVALWAESTLRNFDSNFWATYRQWQSVGDQVRRGETGSEIVFFRKFEEGEAAAKTEGEGEGRPRFVARASRVFNAEQVDDWDDPDAFLQPEADVLEIVEHFVRKTGATVRHGGERAYYSPAEDIIALPERHRFVGSPTSTPQEAYYATVLHELTHWTGAKHRLNREFGKRFGDDAYAMEELVADLERRSYAPTSKSRASRGLITPPISPPGSGSSSKTVGRSSPPHALQAPPATIWTA